MFPFLALIWLGSEFIYYFPVTALQLSSDTSLTVPRKPDEVLIAITGDILLDDRMRSFVEANGYDAPFRYTRALLKSCDFAIGNLEGPITINGAPDTKGKTWAYKMAPKAARALKRAGFDLMTLGNNHVRDCGTIGIKETLQYLQQAGIAGIGAGTNVVAASKPHRVSIRELRLAFFSFMPPFGKRYRAQYHQAGKRRAGAAIAHLAGIRQLLRLHRDADVRIGVFHLGSRYETGLQKTFGPYLRKMLDAGFDVIICHGTHIRGPIEMYRGKPIYYGVGNFAFGSQNPRARFGLLPVLHFSISSRRLQRITVYPLFTNNASPALWYQTRILSGVQGSSERKAIVAQAVRSGTVMTEQDLSLVHLLSRKEIRTNHSAPGQQNL